jgi:hypothetical protein
MVAPLQARLDRLALHRFQDSESMDAIDDALEGADMAPSTSLVDASANPVARSSDRTEMPALP